jgi:hypothetical protein
MYSLSTVTVRLTKYGTLAPDTRSVDWLPAPLQPASAAPNDNNTSDMSFAREFITRVLPRAGARDYEETCVMALNPLFAPRPSVNQSELVL